MKGFLIEIAVVNSAARLTGFPLAAHYAVFGAMSRYCGFDAAGIQAAEGIEDLPWKAESFCFGVHCGNILHKYLQGFSDREIMSCEARIARAFFLTRPLPEGIPAEERKRTMQTVLEALVKRAQIRTHTAKPGYEDIHAWLTRYRGLQMDCGGWLPELAEMIVEPEKADMAAAEKFLREDDLPVGLALPEQPGSIFGRVLQEIVQTAPVPSGK